MTVYVGIFAGQSNMVGADSTSTPAGLPDSTIPFWLNDFHYNDGTHAWGDLRVSPHASVFSHEITMLRRLQAAGRKVAGIKLVQGATFSNRWIPTAGVGSAASLFYPELAEAIAALPAEFPGETDFRFLWVWDQGEEEARYNDLPTVLLWESNLNAIKAGIENVIATTLPNCAQTLRPYVVRTYTNITGLTTEGMNVKPQQEHFAGDSDHWFDTDVYAPAGFKPDGVHRLGASNNDLGGRIGDQILEDIFMGSVSDYLANKLWDHALGGVPFTPPVTIYAAAFVGNTEATQVARKAITNNATNFPNSASRLKNLATQLDFAAAGGDAGAITAIRFYDASSGGNELARDSIAPVTINDAGVLSVAPNMLSFLCPAGCGSDYLVHKLMDLAFGAVSWSAPATVYIASYAGDPQASGTQLHPARVSVTNNATNWPAATSRLKSLGVLQSHASTSSNLGTATHAGILDASSAGNLLLSTAITPVVVDGTADGGLAKTLKYRPNELTFDLAA